MVLSIEEIEKRIGDSYELTNRVLDVMPEPMVTVRTSTYQHAPYIKQCIEGVLMQKTTFPFEFIIGEDFSTDGTRKTVFEYAKKYPDIIRVITADYNVGSKANGRRCTRASRGKYMAICEGDDYWIDPSKLQKQFDQMQKHPACHISFHPAYVTNANGVISNRILSKHKSGNIVFGTSDIILGGGGFCPTASLMLRNKFETFGPEAFMRKAPVGDYFHQIFGSLNGGALYIDQVMAVYRKGIPGSWSSSVQAIERYILYQKKLIETLNELNNILNYRFDKEINIVKSIAFFRLSKTYLRLKNFERFKLYIKKSWFSEPFLSIGQTIFFLFHMFPKYLFIHYSNYVYLLLRMRRFSKSSRTGAVAENYRFWIDRAKRSREKT